MVTVYEEINYMENWTFIAGSSWQVNFTTFESDGTTPLDMTAGSASYRIAPLGDNENTLVDLTGIFDDISNGVWHVILESSDTTGIAGVFTGQARLVDFGGDVFLPGQGRVTILPENTV